MNTNEDEAQQSRPCCNSSQESDVCCSSGGQGKILKRAIFVIVVLLACVVAAHSLLTKEGETAGLSGVVSSFDTTGLPAKVPALSEQPSKEVAVPCGVTLDSIKSLGTMADAKGASVAFIFLAGENEEQARSASTQVEAVVNKLSAQGKRVATFTLKNGAEGYEQLVEQFSVKTLPSVIVVGKGCGAAAVSGEITEAKLLGAFIRASMPISSCRPRSGSSCCPPRPKR